MSSGLGWPRWRGRASPTGTRSNPQHPSLQFKRISQTQPVYSVRIGIGYRALGLRDADHVYWFWIGSQAEYDELLKRL